MTDVCAAPFVDGTWMACNYRSLHVLVIVSAPSGRRFSCLGERVINGDRDGASLVIVKYLREGILFQRDGLKKKEKGDGFN